MNLWFIALYERRGDIFEVPNISDCNIISAPEGHYYADPFLADHDGKTYLFFEDYDRQKGVLSVGEYDGVSLTNVRTILDEPKHLSFPSVWKHGDDWYMTPERCLAGELLVYKAEKFPDMWVPVSLVAKGRYDDPVLYKVKNGFEIWCCEDGDKRRIFRSPEIETGFDTWNLVYAKDEQFARPAGHFIGNIRPVQDSVPTYGRAIMFKDGDKVIHTIEPTWYDGLTGTHTFNVSEKYVAIDGRIKLS